MARGIWFSILAFAFLLGCGKGYHDVGPDIIREKPKVITYSWVMNRVFLPNCSSCHDESSYKAKGGNIPLYNYDHFVMEGDSVWSEISRDRMPKDGVKLTPFEKSCVQDWFAAGMPK